MLSWFDVAAVIIIAGTIGAGFASRPFLIRYIKYIFVGSVLLICLESASLSFVQYRAWEADPLSRFLLPPYQTGYFFSYIGYQVFAPWLLSLLAAIFAGRMAQYWNTRLGNKFFEPEEIWFIRSGFFLSGYPGFIIYALLMLAAGLLLTTYYLLLTKGRAPLYHLWLPVAIISLLIRDFLMPASLLGIFKL